MYSLRGYKDLLDKAMEDIKIYSVKTSNIRQRLPLFEYYLKRLNKFDIRCCHVK